MAGQWGSARDRSRYDQCGVLIYICVLQWLREARRDSRPEILRRNLGRIQCRSINRDVIYISVQLIVIIGVGDGHPGTNCHKIGNGLNAASGRNNTAASQRAVHIKRYDPIGFITYSSQMIPLTINGRNSRTHGVGHATGVTHKKTIDATVNIQDKLLPAVAIIFQGNNSLIRVSILWSTAFPCLNGKSGAVRNVRSKANPGNPANITVIIPVTCRPERG